MNLEKSLNVKASIQALATSAAYALGYQVTARWRVPEKPLADLLAAVFKRHDIQCVCDVGANRGQFAAFLRQQVGYRNRIISFEPIAANAEHMRTKAKASKEVNWTIIECALGRIEGQAELNVMVSDVFSSFLAPAEISDSALAKMNSVVRRESVSVRTLDALMLELGIDVAVTPTALKIDTQGFDLEVVAGAQSTLKHIRCVQSEVSVTPLYIGMPDMMQSLNAFGALGYKPAGLFAVTRDDALAAVEFDAVLVRPLAPT